MNRRNHDLPEYDEHGQGLDQDIRELTESTKARNASLARYKGGPAALAVHLNGSRELKGIFKLEQPDTNLKFAVIYLRVSSEEQAKKGGTAEGYSIPFQRQACRAKAAAMGLVVIEEYVDAGHSAKSANRPRLKTMLSELAARQVKFVIVHKIDRLARNKRDDFLINEAIAEAGAALVSVVDLVDDTPQGKFNYTIQAGLAQLYVDNLAVEVMKGLTKKVESGGTPYRVPVGYLNRRRIEGVADIRWVETDPDRAPFITWAFEEYATGSWSISRLREALIAKGFVTRATRKYPGKQVSVNGLHKILTNPYYAGIVPYRGVYHEGTHEPLIDMTTWLRVQDVLHAHNAAGEKDRSHPHYLKGSIFCGGCSGRLIFSRNTGRNGHTVDYFFCLGRRPGRGGCTRKYVQVRSIEAGVEDYYRTFEVPDSRISQIQEAVRDELVADYQQAEVFAARAKKNVQAARDEREKLLQAHYAGAVPLDLLKREMDRLVRAISSAEEELTAATTSVTNIEAQLKRALLLAGNCARGYLEAKPAVRRLMNQGFFAALYIGPEGEVERAELTEPFAALLAEWADQAVTDDGRAAQEGPGGPETAGRAEPRAVLTTIQNGRTPGRTVVTRGSNLISLAEAEGFEPPDGCPSSAFKLCEA
jgi:site-specific DNA recombinase